LTLLIQKLQSQSLEANALYQRCFDHVFAFLAGASRFPMDPGLSSLSDSVALVERGDVLRSVLAERFVQYVIPRRVWGRDVARALRVPGFNAPISSECLLWPEARARFDRERVQLVSVEAEGGFYHDLFLPGYAWADTPRSWRPPGLRAEGDSNTHLLVHPALADAASALERASGLWTLARRVTPFSTLEGRGFPVVLSFLAEGRPAPSSLEPELVAERLAEAFRD
jgi:hypothetical protein